MHREVDPRRHAVRPADRHRLYTTVRELLHRLAQFRDRGLRAIHVPARIRPTAGSGWASQGHPDRLPATYHRTHRVRYFHGCYSVGDDRL